MKDTFEGQEKFFCKYQDKIKAYFKEQIEKNGELIITTTSQFLRCSL